MVKIGSFQIGLLVIQLLCPLIALAGTLAGELDKTEGTLEDQFIYTLVIQGSFEGEPQFPVIDGLEAQKAGTSQSVSIINGKFSREVQVQFVITPQRAGTYTIPPLKLKVDKQDLETLALELKVLDSPSNQGTGDSAAGADRAVFLEREFDRTKIYVGESIIAKLKLFNRVKLFGASPQINYPPSFQQKPMGDQLNYQRTIEGQDYTVTELRTLLTPSKPGTFEVSPAIVEAQVPAVRRGLPRSMLDDWIGGGMRNVETKRYRSTAASIEVLALPLEGRRSDFSGLVGSFALESQLSTTAVKQGETVTLTVEVKGLGSTVGMSDPQLSYPELAKVYRDKPQSQDRVDPDRGLTGHRIYKFAIVPTKAGLLELGTLKLQIFDPSKGAYQDLTTDLGQVKVEAAGTLPAKDGKEAPDQDTLPDSQARSKPVVQVAEDLVEPHGLRRLLTSDTISETQWYVGAGSLVLAWLLVPTLALWQRWQATAEQRQSRKRRSQAYKRMQKDLGRAFQLLDGSPTKEAVVQARQAVIRYLFDKLSLPASSMTAKDISQRLLSLGLDSQSSQAVQELWQRMDQLLYAKEPARPEECRALGEQIQQIFAEVDRRC